MERKLSDLLTEEAVLIALQQVVDPELGINIVDLGLIYGIDIAESSMHITMTMTSPGCPLAGLLEKETRAALQNDFPRLSSVFVEIVWEPQWSPMMMSWAVRQQLG
jgi:metal-sulfur cluster biosynthetic enzyme